MSDYTLLDSGDGQKLEQFGPYRLVRPAPMALWTKREATSLWESADATFSREEKGEWIVHTSLPKSWVIQVVGISMQLKLTPFGHLGIFPEQIPLWQEISKRVVKGSKVLNLFAYSGGASLAAACHGAKVCHVDAAHGMVSWAQENAKLNKINSIRWMVDDAKKFMLREKRRGTTYDAIILDPPSFGRGKSGQVFKIERDLPLLLSLSRDLLSDRPLFVLFSAHTPGYTPTLMRQLLIEHLGSSGTIDAGDMELQHTFNVPSGTYALWSPHAK